MTFCQEKDVEVLAHTIDGEPAITVLCGACHQTIIATERDWYVIDYGAIQQSVTDHLNTVRKRHLSSKWKAFFKGLMRS